MLAPDARVLIAKGLGLLGTACVNLGEVDQAEEVFRIGIQYAQDGVAAADLFMRLGEALLVTERPGEAIGPLRRAMAFGGDPQKVFPRLAKALLRRGKVVGALAALRAARDAGVEDTELADDLREVEKRLGAALTAWQAASLGSNTPGSQ